MKKVLLVCLFMWFCLIGTSYAQWSIDDSTSSTIGIQHTEGFMSLSGPGISMYGVHFGSGFALGEANAHGEGNTSSGASATSFSNIYMDQSSMQVVAYGINGGNNLLAIEYVKVGQGTSSGAEVYAPNAAEGGYYGGTAGGPGFYIKDKNPQSPQYGRIQYFPNGQSTNPQSEWSFLGQYAGNDGPVNDFASSSSIIGATAFQASKIVQGSPSSGAIAWNGSGGSFIAADFDSDSGKHEASAGTFLSGSIETGGFSFTSIAPQSATAITGNFARIDISGTPDYYSGGVFGGGHVGTYVVSPDAIATGTADFSYNGKTFGFGVGGVHSEIYDGGWFSVSKTIGRINVGAF